MEESTSREKVLKNIRNALVNVSTSSLATVDFDSPIYKELQDLPELSFAQELIQSGGKFIYCENRNALIDSLLTLSVTNHWDDIFCLEPEYQELLTSAGIAFFSGENSFAELKIGITGCECLVARLGSVLVSSKQPSGRRLSFFAETHVVIARVSQVVSDLKDAFAWIAQKYGSQLPSLMTFITGPSRTADIEKTLVMGAHGPKELIVFLVEG